MKTEENKRTINKVDFIEMKNFNNYLLDSELYKIFDFEDYVSELVVDGVNVSGYISKGSGCYLMLIFSILIFISGIILTIEKANNNE